MIFNDVTIVSVKKNEYRTYSWYKNKDKAINRTNTANSSKKVDHCEIKK